MPDRSSPLHVLIVDDHELVRLGIRHLLGERGQFVEASSLRQALDAVADSRFDLILLDLSLGDDFSLGALPRLREAAPSARIVVLTSLAEDLYAERSLRAGADGYVMKSALGSHLLQAVDTVLSGQVYVSAELGSSMLRRMAGRPSGDARPELSARETEVLRLIASGKSTREIAEALNRSVKTIETHKQALKTKLGADSPSKLVRLAVAWFGEIA